MHAAIGVAQHRKRRVVAHRAHGLLAVIDHGMEDHLEILDRPADRELAAAQLVGREAGLVRRVLLDQRIELDGAGRPRGVVLGVGEHVLQLAVLVELRLVHIDRQHLARAEPALLEDLALFLRHHAGLGARDQQVVGSLLVVRDLYADLLIEEADVKTELRLPRFLRTQRWIPGSTDCDSRNVDS